MNRPRMLLSCVSLSAGLLLWAWTPRTPAPHVPTFAEEIAATRQQLARVRVQLRQAQAKQQWLSLRLSPALRPAKLPRRDRPRIAP